jgi:hypothetical protein
MRQFALALLLMGLAACRRDPGERCNPAQFSDNGIQGNCGTGYACIYPTASNCGVAYCCKVDANGNNIDPSPICRPDPTLLSVCPIDMSLTDGSSHD